MSQKLSLLLSPTRPLWRLFTPEPGNPRDCGPFSLVLVYHSNTAMNSVNIPSEKIEYARHDAPESLSSDYATEQRLIRSLLFKLDTR